MGSIFSSWKTSLLGLVTGILYVASQQYVAGMTWKQWGLAVAIAVWGFVSKDFNATGGTVPVTPEAHARVAKDKLQG